MRWRFLDGKRHLKVLLRADLLILIREPSRFSAKNASGIGLNPGKSAAIGHHHEIVMGAVALGEGPGAVGVDCVWTDNGNTLLYLAVDARGESVGAVPPSIGGERAVRGSGTDAHDVPRRVQAYVGSMQGLVPLRTRVAGCFENLGRCGK